MIKSSQFLSALLILSILSFTCHAQEQTGQKNRVTPEMTEKSLLEGAKSDNEGLKISSTYYLGERKTEDAVIPLMDILHNDKSEQARIMAALSLFKIGDSRGIYAIKKSSESDSSKTVKKMCGIFYNMHLEQKKAENTDQK